MNTTTLRFGNPVFKNGENITVRRGIEKSMYSRARPEHIDGTYIDTVEIFPKVYRFADLRHIDLSNEHLEVCRTYDGLLKEMRYLYNNFNEYEIVTLISFNYLEI
jgi:hypothetical protein